MKTLQLLQLLLASAPRSVLAADPSCETGLISGNACCVQSCGQCGGIGCGKLPGGAANCCADKIEQGSRHCDEYDPPCDLLPSPNPPSPSPSAAAMVIDGAAAIAHVAPEFVSFTMDSSSVYGIDLSGKNSASGGYGATLDVLTRALLPAHLRVGGTQGDYDVYTGFDASSTASCSNLPSPMTDYRCKEVTPAKASLLLNYVARNNLTMAWGLNCMFGRPTKTKPEKKLCKGSDASGCPALVTANYEALLAWLTSASQAHLTKNIVTLELGNELNSCLNGDAGAKAQASDFATLKKHVAAAWDASKMTPPKLAGPDTHSAAEFSDAGVEWFATFVNENAGKGVMDHHTFHMYSLGNGPRLDPLHLDDSYLSPQSLNKCGEGVRALQAAMAPELRGTLWAGETAAANQGGQSGITDTYIDGFWYLDQLGQLAALNVSVFLRQTMISSGGYPLIESGAGAGGIPLPLPDYYIAVLHTKLMGTTVLNTSSSARNVRLYAHCARDGLGGVAVAFLNIALNTSVTVTLPPAIAASKTRVEYVLTAGSPIKGAKSPLQSQFCKLNGVALTLTPGASVAEPATLPAMKGAMVANTKTIVLAPSTYGFLHFPDASVPACGGASVANIQE